MNKFHFRCLGGLFVALFMVAAAAAQENSPPGCCKEFRGASTLSSGKTSSEEFKQTQLVISADASTVLGITREQFIDRLAGALLPGREVYLIVPLTQLLPPSDLAPNQAASSAAGGVENRLLAVQETRYYQVSRNQIRSEDLNQLSHLYISDGHTFLKIIFSKNDFLGMD